MENNKIDLGLAKPIESKDVTIETVYLYPKDSAGKDLPFCPFAQPAQMQLQGRPNLKIAVTYFPCSSHCQLWDAESFCCKMGPL